MRIRQFVRLRVLNYVIEFYFPLFQFGKEEFVLGILCSDHKHLTHKSFGFFDASNVSYGNIKVKVALCEIYEGAHHCNFCKAKECFEYINLWFVSIA